MTESSISQNRGIYSSDETVENTYREIASKNPSNKYAASGLFFRAHRVAFNYTQTRYASILNFDNTTISRIEDGTRTVPRRDSFVKKLRTLEGWSDQDVETLFRSYDLLLPSSEMIGKRIITIAMVPKINAVIELDVPEGFPDFETKALSGILTATVQRDLFRFIHGNPDIAARLGIPFIESTYLVSEGEELLQWVDSFGFFRQ